MSKLLDDQWVERKTWKKIFVTRLNEEAARYQ
jgi:hypothetical protein